MPEAARRDLRKLPKAHLHLHLEAAQRPSMLRDLTERYGLPTQDPLDGTFETFLLSARAVFFALREPDDYIRLFREMAEDALAQGVVWLEPAVWLTPRAVQLGLAPEAGLEFLVDAAHRAEAATGIGIGLIVEANRTSPVAEAVELAHLAARYAGRGVIGFGLADDEARGPAELFAEAFAIARAAGLIAAPHAGEVVGPPSVRPALDTLGAHRIAHGVRAIEDPALVERLATEGICLDVCPTSNIQLGVVPSIEEHPLPALIDGGVKASLNTDDPVIFGCTIVDEYEMGRISFGFDDTVLARIAADSIRASGAPRSVVSRALAGIDGWIAGRLVV